MKNESYKSLNFNEKYLENINIFNDNEKEKIKKLNKNIDLKNWFSIKRNIEEFSIEFAIASSKLEGNTYTNIEAVSLLKSNRTINNKPIEDALMLINMRESFIYITEVCNDKKYVNQLQSNCLKLKEFIKELHSITSNGMLNKKYQGEARDHPVKILGTKYKTLDNKYRLDEYMDKILNNYIKIKDPLDKSLYIHNNLAYLQYFQDQNKRTARNMMAFTLLSNNIMPILFDEFDKNAYPNAIIEYYEKCEYKKSKEYFIKCFEAIEIEYKTKKQHKNIKIR